MVLHDTKALELRFRDTVCEGGRTELEHPTELVLLFGHSCIPWRSKNGGVEVPRCVGLPTKPQSLGYLVPQLGYPRGKFRQAADVTLGGEFND
mgnify:CR=1 FL=1